MERASAPGPRRTPPDARPTTPQLCDWSQAQPRPANIINHHQPNNIKKTWPNLVLQRSSTIINQTIKKNPGPTSSCKLRIIPRPQKKKKKSKDKKKKDKKEKGLTASQTFGKFGIIREVRGARWG